MNEKELVSRLRAKEEQAFEELVQSYGPRLLRGARLLTGQSQLAEVLVSDAFAEAFFALPRYRAEAPLFNWLYGIMLNQFRYHCRKHKHFINLESVADSLEAKETPVDDSDMLKRLPDCIGKLSPEHSSVIVLKYLEGKTTEEIADILAIPSGTVKSRVHNALEFLRKTMNQMNLLPNSATD
ncbi:MAG: RNA polymerase sigma factor [Planctomycetota bacterium]